MSTKKGLMLKNPVDAPSIAPNSGLFPHKNALLPRDKRCGRGRNLPIVCVESSLVPVP